MLSQFSLAVEGLLTPGIGAMDGLAIRWQGHWLLYNWTADPRASCGHSTRVLYAALWVQPDLVSGMNARLLIPRFRGEIRQKS